MRWTSQFTGLFLFRQALIISRRIINTILTCHEKILLRHYQKGSEKKIYGPLENAQGVDMRGFIHTEQREGLLDGREDLFLLKFNIIYGNFELSPEIFRD